MNNNKKSKSSKGSERAQARVAGPSVNAPVAHARAGRLSMGLSDISSLKIGYVAGSIKTGGVEAGTDYKLGLAGQLFFTATISGAEWTPIAANDTKYSGPVPIAPADATYGMTYLKNLFMLFRRKRFKKVRLVVVPQGQGIPTTGTHTIVIAPGRSGEQTFLAAQLDGTTAYPTNGQQTYGQLAGCRGSHEFPSWKGAEIDLTPYISGPGGGKEFSTSGEYASMPYETLAAENAGRVPCHFWVGGTTAATTSVVVASVRVELEVDLIDFSSGLETLGNVAAPRPRGVTGVDEKVGTVASAQPSSAGATSALPPGVPSLTRQTGYVMVQQDDLPSLALAKGRGGPPNDPNRRP
jgi:hypothetical protein